MPVSENAGRANSPTARENTSHLDDVKEGLENKITDLKELLVEKISGIKDTIKQHDDRYAITFKSMDEMTKMSLANSKEAITKAEIATEKRFDSVNEFRGSLKDQAATLFPRTEADGKFKAYDDKLEDAKKEINSLREYRTGATATSHLVGHIQEKERSKFEFNANTLLAIAALVMSIISPILVVLIMKGLK